MQAKISPAILGELSGSLLAGSVSFPSQSIALIAVDGGAPVFAQAVDLSSVDPATVDGGATMFAPAIDLPSVDLTALEEEIVVVSCWLLKRGNFVRPRSWRNARCSVDERLNRAASRSVVNGLL